MLGFLLLMSIGLALAWSGAVIYTVWMLTHPPRRTYASAVARNLPGDPGELPEPLPFERYRIGTEGLPAWDVAGHDPSGVTFVLAHGWGDSRIGALARIPALAAMSARIVTFDGPGHGEAPGVCRLGTREVDALRRAVHEARARDPDARIVLLGWSMGAGVALALASEGEHRAAPLAGVVAESPYAFAVTPARNVMRYYGLPWRATLPAAMAAAGVSAGIGPGWRGFDRRLHAARIRCPVLVLHGSEDEISPIEDGRAIADACPAGELAEIRSGHHNDLWTDPTLRAECGAAVERFVRAL